MFTSYQETAYWIRMSWPISRPYGCLWLNHDQSAAWILAIPKDLTNQHDRIYFVNITEPTACPHCVQFSNWWVYKDSTNYVLPTMKKTTKKIHLRGNRTLSEPRYRGHKSFSFFNWTLQKKHYDIKLIYNQETVSSSSISKFLNRKEVDMILLCY